MGIKSHSENHCSNIFGRGRFKKVGSPAGAISNIVSDKIGNNCRISGIIFGNSRLNLPNQIGSNIRRFGINSTSKLSEQSNQTGSKPETDQQSRDFNGRVTQKTVNIIKSGNTNQT